MFKPQISVIVPMYNAESTISRCLISLARQSLKNIEIIVVDDASLDNSVEKVVELSKQYSNIRLIKNTKNRGAGITKNIGLSNCKADIVGFCDADDFVNVDYFETLVVALEKNNADIACCDMALVYKNHIEYLNIFKDNIYDITNKTSSKDSGDVYVISAEQAVAHCVSASAASKVFRKSIIKEFFDGACDDLYFTYPALVKAKKIVYKPATYYFYMQNEGSLERSEFNEKRLTLGNCLTKTTEAILADSKNAQNVLKIIYAYSSWGILRDILDNREHRRKYLKVYFNNLKYRNFLNQNEYLLQLLLSKSIGEQLYILKLISLFLSESYGEMCDLFDSYDTFPETYLPKVSIVIPVYNGSNYLREAILSALGQDYPNFEVIVINDGSRDGGKTEQIAKSFGNRIRYYAKANGGVASALNLGIEKMNGEYFSWLSHDDLYKKDKIISQINELQFTTDKKGIVVSGYDVVNKHGDRLYDVSPLKIYKKEQLETPLFAVFHGCINGCSVLIHKSHFERVGNFNVNLPTTQDYDLWFRIMRGQRIYFSAYNGVLSRVHEEQDSKKLFDKHLIECNKLWISLIKNLSPEEMEEIAGSVSEFYFDERNFFKQLPYKQVSYFLDGKILEILRESLTKKIDYSYKRISQLFSISPSIINSKCFVNLLNNCKWPYAVIVTQEQLDNPDVQNILNGINKLSKGKCLNIVLDQNHFFEVRAGEENSFNYPHEERETLPNILKLLKCNTVMYVISSSDCILTELEMYSAMEIKTYLWNCGQHWIFQNKATIEQSATRILQNKLADIVIWSDKYSYMIDCLNSNTALFVPIERINKLPDEFNNLIKNISCQSDNKTEQPECCDYDILLKKVVSNYEMQVLQYINAHPLNNQIIEKKIYLDGNGDDWKERYEAVINSTSWKITKIPRAFMDRVKKIINK